MRGMRGRSISAIDGLIDRTLIKLFNASKFGATGAAPQHAYTTSPPAPVTEPSEFTTQITSHLTV